MSLTAYQCHLAKWKNGCGSGLCTGATKVVLCRGSLPCDVLFIGEAPGVSEDALGRPFVGPAGKLLDRIIDRAADGIETQDRGPRAMELRGPIRPLRFAFTNLVGCLPRDPDGRKASEPLPEEIGECAPRLEEFVAEVAKPRFIVCVGDHANHWIIGTKGKRHLLLGYTGRLVHVVHPAAILRANQAQQGLMRQRVEVVLRNALEEL